MCIKITRLINHKELKMSFPLVKRESCKISKGFAALETVVNAYPTHTPPGFIMPPAAAFVNYTCVTEIRK
jgi:hypothetical protein